MCKEIMDTKLHEDKSDNTDDEEVFFITVKHAVDGNF